jgi:hypothetical protein
LDAQNSIFTGMTLSHVISRGVQSKCLIIQSLEKIVDDSNLEFIVERKQNEHFTFDQKGARIKLLDAQNSVFIGMTV